MLNYSYIKNQRGNQNMIFDDFLFNLDKTNELGTKWRCLKRTCLATCLIDNDGNLTCSKKHNHEKMKKQINNLIISSNLKEKATKSSSRTKEIIVRLTSELEDNQISDMQKLKSLGNIITKERNKKLQNFSIQNDDIPLFLKNNLKNEEFLRFDSGQHDENRIVIFMSDFCKNFLKKSKIWLIDATFYASPKPFTQILTIHGFLFGKTFPLAYILMSNKKEHSYVKVFEQIKILLENDPERIIVDFERGLSNAFIAVFKSVKITYCLFHFGQSIWRKLQELDLSSEYLKNIEFKKIIRLLLNLAFVPNKMFKSEWEKVFKCCVVREEITKKFEKFLIYFQNTYISREKNNENQDCLFKHEFWSVYDNIKENIPRTTCSVEAWHRSLNSATEIAHPNFGKVVEMIRSEEEVTRVKLIQERAGNITFPQKDYTREERLRSIIDNYYLYDEMGYFTVLNTVYQWNFELN